MVLWSLISIIPRAYTQDNFPIEIGTSINPVGSGARAMGLGNAFIAIADDATAASWNPAGLLQLETLELSFAVEAIWFNQDLVSSSNSEVSGRNDLHLDDLNYASLVFPFFFHTNMVFSLNYLKLYRFDKSLGFPILFPAPSPAEFGQQRFFEFDQEGAFSALIPAYGFDLTDNLSIGVTFNIWNDTITGDSSLKKQQRSIGRDFVPNIGDVKTFEEVNEEKLIVDSGYSFTIGGLYRINRKWNIGFVIKPPFQLNVDQKITRTLDERFITADGSPPPEITSSVEREDSDFEFPINAGGGIAWRPLKSLVTSLDITWTDWSEFNLRKGSQDINPISGRDVDVGKLKDTITLRLGCEYVVVRDTFLIPLRFGLGYDPAPAVGGVDDYFTASLGSGFQIGNYNLDIAWEFRWGNNVNKDLFQGINATEDLRQNRILASLIYYF